MIFGESHPGKQPGWLSCFNQPINCVTLQTDLRLKKSCPILAVLFFICLHTHAQQPLFSIATSVDIQRSFKKEQQFWAVGHTTIANFHLAPKNGIYVWFCYYSDGIFKNQLVATAKLPSTTPQQINYVNNAKMRFKQFSVGWKHYLKGTPDTETKWNLYGYAGLGLLLGRVINTHSVPTDTARYNVPVRSGKANFKRLTLDIGLGYEHPIGGDFYLYTEGKAWIPTTDYPSEFIFVNAKAPVAVMVAFGIRLLF